MKISGFTIIRNGVEFDYPFEESIASLLPLVDELVVNVGISTDSTLQVIQRIKKQSTKKIIIIESEWPLSDPEKRKGGLILSEQTNIALNACTGDWCIYLQADEVFHEDDRHALLESMNLSQGHSEIDAVLFDYVHLYGSYDVEQYTRSAYRREVRAIKNRRGLMSVGDAQSFRHKDGRKPTVIKANARVFHYGWVRTPDAMKSKTEFMDTLYRNDGSTTGENYRYKRFWGLRPFKKTHPKYMHQRIKQKGWHWDLSNSEFVWSIKDGKKIVSDALESVTDFRPFEYRSYNLISRPHSVVRNLRSSVLLATYNMPKHLELVLESLLRQSEKSFELIICDDGSDFLTADLVEKYRHAFEKQDRFLLHLWQPNKGFRKTRLLNQGLLRARGDLVVFLDGDCVPHRSFIEDHCNEYKPGHYSAGRRIELGEKLSAKLNTDSVRNGFFDRPNAQLIKSVLSGDTTHLQRSLRFKPRVLRSLLGMNKIDDLKGCNFSVSREDLLKIGGFDEAYEGYGREDTDVELRLKNLGLKINSLKGLALQYHVWHPRREFTPQNESLLEDVKKSKRILPLKSTVLGA
jgi:glycosyltransferase involved in cell wall biosynthesis